MAVDFKAALSRQLDFLQSSCTRYDSGTSGEAIRIATVLRVLFHQTKSSTPLLAHLNARHIRLLSTTLDIIAKLKEPRFASCRLEMYNGMAQIVGGQLYRPKLGQASTQTQIPANEWWRQIVFALDEHTLVARKDIVLDAADKDGGAHVDSKLPLNYERLIESHDLGSWRTPNGELEPIRNHHYLALR